MRKYPVWLTVILSTISFVVVAQDKPLHIYVDADFSGNPKSAEAIFLGVQTAFDEVGNQVQGFDVKLIKKDHRSNVNRSLLHQMQYVDDKYALAVMAGMHSPPIIHNLKYINQNKILTLVPWAAASKVTRYPSKHNYIFRLSIDDTKAGPFLVKHALKKRQCEKPFLLIENTSWGDGNHERMLESLADFATSPVSVTRFDWGLDHVSSAIIARDVVRSGADCLLMVANAQETIHLMNAFDEVDMPSGFHVISHWGATGSDFEEAIGFAQREKLNFEMIHTCHPFLKSDPPPKANKVIQKLTSNNTHIRTIDDLQPSAGFVHAYDLTRILIAAIYQTNLSDDMALNRSKVKEALESPSLAQTGLMREFKAPFGQIDPFNPETIDNHEALDESDFCMVYYDELNHIRLKDD